MDLAMVRWRKKHGVSTEDDAEGGHGHHIGSWERRMAEGEVGAYDRWLAEEHDGAQQPAHWEDCNAWLLYVLDTETGVFGQEYVGDVVRAFVNVLLWRWRQWWFAEAVGCWRQQQRLQRQCDSSRQGWSRLLDGFRRLTWAGYSRFFRRQRGRGRCKGGAIWAVQLVGSVLWMAREWRSRRLGQNGALGLDWEGSPVCDEGATADSAGMGALADYADSDPCSDEDFSSEQWSILCRRMEEGEAELEAETEVVVAAVVP